ncbi:FecR family protein [Stenotrophomonas maltophilia]|uniref:FecR family protein n=1 Tax=Stenotrophomonas maltophilia TaxID=40324 RepID=UPI0039F6E702
MDADHRPHRTLDAIERQAHAWVVRLTSGEATAADGKAFRAWCEADPAHRSAFAQARRQWEQVRVAGGQLPAAARQPQAPTPVQRWSRRAFLGAAVAAPASLAVVAALRPPMGLWPSVTALASDYHTGTGERLRITPSADLAIELDTQTSLRRRSDTRGEGYELMQGQAALETLAGARLALFAGQGCVLAGSGPVRLDVRHTDGQVRVTCLRGSARIEHPQGRLQLQAGQQTRYDERLSGVVVEAVAAEAGAWTEGMLVFRRAPLRDVVEEINRYRRGKVMLGANALARAPVSGRFRIDDPDAALEQLRLTMSLGLRRYPGGIAVLG